MTKRLLRSLAFAGGLLLLSTAQTTPVYACLQPGWSSATCALEHSIMYAECSVQYSGTDLEVCQLNASIFLDNCTDACHPH